MPNIGPMEIAIVVFLALLVFGPKRLPELGRSLGRGMREFKQSVSGLNDIEEEIRDKTGSPAELKQPLTADSDTTSAVPTPSPVMSADADKAASS